MIVFLPAGESMNEFAVFGEQVIAPVTSDVKDLIGRIGISGD